MPYGTEPHHDERAVRPRTDSPQWTHGSPVHPRRVLCLPTRAATPRRFGG